MPDTTDYLTRISNYAQGKDPLELQNQTPVVLAELVATASDEQLTRRPSKDKWSISEILAHLAEDEIATAWRYRQMVEHTGLQLAGFDQDLWARIGDYASRVPQESLALFRLLRNANLQFLQQISPEQWECFGIHAERGRITIRDLVVHMAGHDANHIDQIRRILR
ncbi:MAG TPA: DinB family protein [Candidatus Sulfotelmatobacter sp.]|nr:DinB family protein [Candidatus Sulfotelmatobacter sp.]